MRRLCLILALPLIALPAHAQVPTGDPDVGGGIARTWCANCHVVEARPTRGGDAVPSFSAIAAMPSTTALSLTAFLQTPHGRMPNFQLSRQQIDDAVAYILSLKGR
jgi:mono/diheme cytochrome c family protein